MNKIQIAVYARVSSHQQSEKHTIESQLYALCDRVKKDGFELSDEQYFIDEGFSGATLLRPALERLRDVIANGGIDRVYVYDPDRLARKYAYQVVLIDEFYRMGVEVVFLNRELGRSPEDDLLLQVQGMVAEYERTKIIERSRRGKRHAAQSGKVSAFSNAPYGYKYISKRQADGQARFEVLLEEAQAVEQIFDWVGHQRFTIAEVCRRLQQAGYITRGGKEIWDRGTVWGILKNPAYTGKAAFGRTRSGDWQPKLLRKQRNSNPQSARSSIRKVTEKEEWIEVNVPAIIDKATYELVQEQLIENQKRARQGKRGACYLLQGLVVCKVCGYSYYGKAISGKAASNSLEKHVYYRCIGRDAYRFGGEAVCCNRQIKLEQLDKAVWQQVSALLEDPRQLEQEYQRRLKNLSSNGQDSKQQSIMAQIGKLRQGVTRLIDSYAEGFIEKSEFEPRIKNLKERIGKLEVQANKLSQEALLQTQLQLIIGRLEEFASKVNQGLEKADWLAQRELIRTLVKRVEIDLEQVNVVFRVSSEPLVLRSEKKSLQDCRKRETSPLRKTSFISKKQICTFFPS